MSHKPTSVRLHIIETAHRIILGKGYAAVGLSEILSAASVPKGSFYHYFKSKDAFGVALLAHYFSNYLDNLDKLLGKDGTPAAERLMRYWQRWLDQQTGNKGEATCLVIKLGGEVSDLSESMRLTLQQGTQQVIGRLAACMMEAINDGSLRDIADPQGAAETLYQLWLGAAMLAKIRRDGEPLHNALQITRQWLAKPSLLP